MIATTDALVRGIIDAQSDVSTDPFIAAANQLASDVFGAYVPPYTDAKSQLIQTWLAAHFYTIFDNQLARAKAGTVSVGYQYKVEMGLDSSIYGQNAMLLDTNQGLAKLQNSLTTVRNVTVSIKWLGTRRRGYFICGDFICN